VIPLHHAESVLGGAITEALFGLALPGAEAWEEVPHRVVKELLDNKRIKAVKISGGTQEEYCLD